MSARIVQVDLSAPLGPIRAGRGGTLMLLVKFGLQPLGWVKCKTGPDGIGVDQLSQLIAQSLALHVHDVARRRLFEPRNPAALNAASDALTFAGDDVTLDRHFQIVLGENFADPSVQCVVGDVWPTIIDDAAVPQRSFTRRTVAPSTWNSLFARKRGAAEPRIALAVRRAMFEALGGLDPALRGEAGKVDLITRVLRGGGVVVYDPRAIAFWRGRMRRNGFRETLEHAAYCSKYFRDAELANLSFKAWQAMLGQSLGACDFSSAAGAVLGVQEYRRARRRLSQEAIRKAA